jgi:peptidoglycan-associated lipoprotein
MQDRSSMRILFTIGVLAGSLMLLGCPKRPEVGQAGPGAVGPAAATAPAPAPAQPSPQTGEARVTQPPAPTETPVQPAPAAQAQAQVPAASPLKDVFFEFDKSAIRDDQKPALNEDVAWLKGNAKAKITVEGHCDERGTAEYNLALGERRAKAVKDYLIAAGVPATLVSTISYGKERPFVLGHDESAWKWNRRGHFVISAQ